jgi:hypothetical protein
MTPQQKTTLKEWLPLILMVVTSLANITFSAGYFKSKTEEVGRRQEKTEIKVEELDKKVSENSSDIKVLNALTRRNSK